MGLGLLVSQLNNYTLAPIEEERVSEAAGINSASGSFGLSFGLAMAGGVMLATLAFSFNNLTTKSAIIPDAEKNQIYTTLEDNAQILSDTQLQEQISTQPSEIQDEVLKINNESRNRSLQAALLIPLLAGIVGSIISFKMVKLPEIEPSSKGEGSIMG